MKLLDFLFAKSESKNSPNDPYDDTFAQEYFKIPANNYYIKKLLSSPNKEHLTNSDIEKLREAYDKAHDIRKFEIDLYWKRTTYIWTLIAALIAICGVLATAYYKFYDPDPEKDKSLSDIRYILLLIIAGIAFLGTMITLVSSLILRSGEYWQKNWEYHVNLLEPLFSGSLYGTLLDENPHWYDKKPKRYSIAKLNTTLIGFFMLAWLIILEGVYVIFTKDLSSRDYFISAISFAFSMLFIFFSIHALTIRKTKTTKLNLSQWKVEVADKSCSESKFQITHKETGTDKIIKVIAFSLLFSMLFSS